MKNNMHKALKMGVALVFAFVLLSPTIQARQCAAPSPILTHKLLSPELEAMLPPANTDVDQLKTLLEQYKSKAQVFCGPHADAETFLKYTILALELEKRLYGDEDASLVSRYNSLAHRYGIVGQHKHVSIYTEDAMANYKQALQYYQLSLECNETALALQIKLNGETPESLDRNYCNKATVYTYQSKYAKALDNYLKILAIREKAYGINHQATAWVYAKIAKTYVSLADYEQSLQFYTKAYESYHALPHASMIAGEMKEHIESCRCLMSEHIYTGTVIGGHALAEAGYEGSYTILQWGTWDCSMDRDLRTEMWDSHHLDKDIVLMDEQGKLSRFHLPAGAAGITASPLKISPQRKAEIVNLWQQGNN